MSNKNTISLSATLSTGGGGGDGKKGKNSSSNNDSNNQEQLPKKPRTIQVKIGNQAAKEMTPDQAADYLRLLATAGAAAAATAGGGGGTSTGGGGGGGRNSSSSSHYHSSSGGGGANGLLPQQVKMTFQNGTTETVPLTSNSSGGSGGAGGSSGNLFRKSSKKGSSSSDPGVNNMPCTEKEMKALMSMFVEIMGLQMNTEKLNKQQYKGGKKKKIKDGKSSTGKDSKKQLFHFPADLPPPPGGWPEDLLWPSGIPGTGLDGDDDDEYEYEDDDLEEECSSLPDLEEIPLDVRQKAAASAATAALTSSTRTAAAEAAKNAASSSTASSASMARKTGLVAGIAVPEWEALERVAMEEALEQEERARKSSKAAASSNSTAASLSTSFLRSTVMEALTSSASSSSGTGGLSGSGGSGGTGSRSATANSQAAAARAAAQATAAQKRRAKASQVWRTKVIAACQSCDVQALDQLLEHDVQVRQELKQLQEKEGSSSGAAAIAAPDDSDPSVQSPTFDVLLPYCLPNSKNHRASMAKTQETRQRLTRHLWNICPSRLSQQPMRNGRTVLHMACLYGDTALVQLILGTPILFDDSLPNNKQSLQALNEGRGGLNFTCQDSGWTPLHYAALSGSMQTLELLLCNGANLTAVTDDIHTYWTSSGKGLTAKQLVDVVASGKVEKQVETHGMALKEVTKAFLTSSTSSNAASDDSNSDVDTRKYLAWLQRISNRLATLEKAKKNSKSADYYTAPNKGELCDWEQEVVSEPVIVAAATASVVVDVDETTKTKAKAAVPAAPAAVVPASDSSESSSSSTGGADTASLVPPASISNQNNETKKKGKKKKKKGGGNNKTNATESAPSSTGSAVTSAMAAEDPVVTALKGMGFAEQQILAGLKACGGASRATPDMVVAWIFEQESGGGASAASGASAAANGSDSGNKKKKDAPIEFTQQKKRGSDTKVSSNKAAGAAKASSSSSQQQQEKSSNNLNAVAEQKRKEVRQREAEKKLAADRLAAKREEQRRRNREWNKKQEAQRAEVVARSSVTSNASTSSAPNVKEAAAAAAAVPTLMTGIPTGMAASDKPGSSVPAPSSLKQPPPGLASLPPPTAATTASMPPAEITTDASTIASSVGDLMNDDATVSTIGSRTTNTQPSIRQTLSNGGVNVVGPPLHHQQQQQTSQSQQHGAPVAPPGFGPSVAAVPESVPMTEETWQQGSMGLGQRLYAPSAPGMAAAPPPGSRPRVDQRAHASSLTAQSMGSLQSRMSAAQEAFSGSFSSSRATPGPATSTAQVGGAPVGGSSGFGPSSLFGLQSSSSSLLGQEQHHHSVSSMSEQNFAQTSTSTLGSHAGMESSSFIESISTGNAPIGGTSLWGGSHHNATGGATGSSLLGSPPGSSGGSSLLGNLIQTNDSRQVDSLFSMDNQRSSSFNGWGEDPPHHPGPGGAPGGGRSTSGGIGGHPDATSSNNNSRGNLNRGSGSSIW